MNDIELLQVLANAADDISLARFRALDLVVEAKPDRTPVTDADKAVEGKLRELLKLYRPTDEVIGEEMDKTGDSNRSWIIDPIDGTKEFIKRNGEFTVNIALVENGVPVLGVVYAPAKGQLFYGDEFNGACFAEGGLAHWHLDEWKEIAQPMPQPSVDRPFTAVASRSHMSPETEEFIDELRALHGSVDLISRGSSLKMCMVAAGFADCYPRFAPTMEWDTAAGQAVCLAAGCEVMNWETKYVLTYNRKELLNPWFLVRGPRALQDSEGAS